MSSVVAPENYEVSDQGDTYVTYIKTENNSSAIQCKICNRVSYSIKDVVNHYCGNCNLFHEIKVH